MSIHIERLYLCSSVLSGSFKNFRKVSSFQTSFFICFMLSFSGFHHFVLSAASHYTPKPFGRDINISKSFLTLVHTHRNSGEMKILKKVLKT